MPFHRHGHGGLLDGRLLFSFDSSRTMAARVGTHLSKHSPPAFKTIITCVPPSYIVFRRIVLRKLEIDEYYVRILRTPAYTAGYRGRITCRGEIHKPVSSVETYPR